MCLCSSYSGKMTSTFLGICIILTAPSIVDLFLLPQDSIIDITYGQTEHFLFVDMVVSHCTKSINWITVEL